jgi:hypothetical protein
VDNFYRRAVEILDVAVAAGAGAGPCWILCVSHGGVTQMSPAQETSSLPAIAAETGAGAVYRVERRPGRAYVEGWSVAASCSVCRELPGEGALLNSVTQLWTRHLSPATPRMIERHT